MSAASTSAVNPPLRLILARHGESEANIDGVFANRPGPGGGLTAQGVAQARHLAESLNTHGLTHVYSSPLERAYQTASIVATSFGVSVTVSDSLREYDVGEFEGLPYTGDHAWRIERYEEIEAAWRRGQREAAHPGGESLAGLEMRFQTFLATVVSAHAPGDIILAISHGGLLRVVLPIIFPDYRASLARTAFDYGVQLTLHHDGSTWTLPRS